MTGVRLTENNQLSGGMMCPDVSYCSLCKVLYSSLFAQTHFYLLKETRVNLKPFIDL